VFEPVRAGDRRRLDRQGETARRAEPARGWPAPRHASARPATGCSPSARRVSSMRSPPPGRACLRLRQRCSAVHPSCVQLIKRTVLTARAEVQGEAAWCRG